MVAAPANAGEPAMRKPNYRFERAERDRAKDAKKRDKIERQQERAATRPENADPQPIAPSQTPEC
jgi:hypothetical protein